MKTSKHFTFEIDENGVGVLTLDAAGRRMNTLFPELGEGIADIVNQIETDAAVRAVVIISGKPDSFIAGADIDVIDTVQQASEATAMCRELQNVFARMERLHTHKGKPVIAAIHGPALGGGLELALACSERVISDSPKTVLGLPEVQLGLIPGAGGTQRLPRLIGIANAIDMILTGKQIRASKARKLGLADEVVPQTILLQVAKERALRAARGQGATAPRGIARLKSCANTESLQTLALEENPLGLRILFKKSRDMLLAKTHGKYPAPERALDVIRMGIMEGIEAGYAAEADRFGQLAISHESKALRSIYHATQALKKDTGVEDPTVQPRETHRIGVLGGGLMGGGIAAMSVMKAGIPVRIHEMDDAGVGRGIRYVQKLVDKDVTRRKRSLADGNRLMQQLTGTTTMSGFENIDVVIEAVFEDLDLKRKMLREVQTKGNDKIIFASNTSSLPLTKIAEGAIDPTRVIGMHYFSPVEKMPLLEIITTNDTAPWVTAACVKLGKAQGKTVIVVRDGTGFYTSRILAPYMNEAAWVLSEGAPIDVIDSAMMDFGFPVGPLTLLDEVGIDVGAKVASIMQEAFGQRMRPPQALETVQDDTRKGRKNCKGFYTYENGKKGGVDATIYGLLGIKPDKNAVAQNDIQWRLALQMINEAALCLQEGILKSPRDGDIGAIFGLGFPPFTGGPFSFVDRTTAVEIVRKLETYAERHGERFEPAQILKDHARSGKAFRG